jgi:hypothetical protein
LKFKLCENCCLHIAEEDNEVTACPRCGESGFENDVEPDGSMKLDSISFCSDLIPGVLPTFYVGLMIAWNEDDVDVAYDEDDYEEDDSFENFIIELSADDLLVMVSNCVRALAMNESINRKAAVDYLTPHLNMLCERAKFDSQRRTEAN